jgi:hypothetical protein
MQIDLISSHDSNQVITQDASITDASVDTKSNITLNILIICSIVCLWKLGFERHKVILLWSCPFKSVH